MQHLLTINGRLDNMNDYTRACRTNQYKGAKMKQKNEAVVIRAILEQLGRLRITKPVIIRYRWYEPNKRRDLDNISSFGRKVIQDALVQTKRNVQKYMRKHKSDEDFIKNISDDFVMGFMISQRMAWDDYDNGAQMKRKDAEK